MGEVYRARDTKLDWDVALKVLPQAFTDDPDRLARFEREAKVLASLNHPNIGHIYGLEEAEGQKALVLELIEGPTLADRIKQGPIPVEEALPIAKQIAEALEAAHEQGAIHRDLKPANIKVREDGTVKVLDFGLAKAFQPGASDVSASMSPTISLTAAATQMGMVIGTAAYMAPEQAKGKVVDKRADVWAFGAVLYEMLTGQKPFVGDDVSETLVSVEKDARRRVGDMSAVRLALDGVFDTQISASTTAAVAPEHRLWQRPVPLSLAAVALLVIGGVSVWTLTRADQSTLRVARFAIAPPASEAMRVSLGRRDLAVSPDGGTVVMSITGGSWGGLYARPLESLSGATIAGFDGPAYDPFFSPDGGWVGFVSFDNGNTGDASLNRVSVHGGPAVRICELESLTVGADWAEDDTIIFGTGQPSGLWRVSVNGGEPEALTIPDAEGVNHTSPDVLPGGRGVLFTASTLGSLDSALAGLGAEGRVGEMKQITLLDFESGEQRVLIADGSAPRYAPSGHIVYAADGTLRAVGFDLDRLEIIDPNSVPVLDGVNMKETTGAADFDIAEDGALVYLPAGGGEVDAEIVSQKRCATESPHETTRSEGDDLQAHRGCGSCGAGAGTALARPHVTPSSV